MLNDLTEALESEFRTQYLSFVDTQPAKAFSFFVQGAPVQLNDLPRGLYEVLTQLQFLSHAADSAGEVVATIRLFRFAELLVATDLLWYREPSAIEGMVMPMHPENALLIESIYPRAGTRVLDVGFGSGIFGMVALCRGASHVVGLDISARAKRFAQFNVLLNCLESSRCDWRLNSDADPLMIFNPVLGERFDLVLCNPPFEVGHDSAAIQRACANGGSDGLEYFRAILPRVSSYLCERGEAHFVFFSVGDDKGPSGILDIARTLEGDVVVEWAENALRTDDFVLWNTGETRVFSAAQRFLWFGRVRLRPSAKSSLVSRLLPAIPNWHWPIYASTPIGYKPEKNSD